MTWLDWHLDRLLPFDRCDSLPSSKTWKVPRRSSKPNPSLTSCRVAATDPFLSPGLLAGVLRVVRSSGQSVPTTGDEEFPVEHGGHDTPCQPIDEEEGGGESQGETERGDDHVERHEGHDGDG